MSKIEARIEELGITLPEASAPVGNYVGAKVVGNMVYLSGNGPLGNADSHRAFTTSPRSSTAPPTCCWRSSGTRAAMPARPFPSRSFP